MDSVPTFILADNQFITRIGMERLLAHGASSGGICQATSKKELIRACMNHPEGIIVIDYTLFDFYGIEDLLVIGKRFPDTYWLLFSADLSNLFIRRLSAESRMGIVLKDCPEEEIRNALEQARARKPFVCRSVAERLKTDSPTSNEQLPLTASETEILRLIANGKSVKEIAELRHSSTHTIVTHKKNIFRKLEVNTSYEATKYALRAGIVEMAEYYI